jgi:hypothetical protein
LRSAINQKAKKKEGGVEPTFMVGLGGEDLDLSPKIKRRPFSAYRTTTY